MNNKNKIAILFALFLIAGTGLPSLYLVLSGDNSMENLGNSENANYEDSSLNNYSPENSTNNNAEKSEYAADNKEKFRGPVEEDLKKLKLSNSHNYFRELQRKNAIENGIVLNPGSTEQERKVISRHRISKKLIDILEAK